MTRILVVGHGPALVAAALRALDGSSRITLVSPPVLADCSPIIPGADDVFAGGGRSKGEKKRAAKERRMRGGY